MDSLNSQKIESALQYVEKWLEVNFRNSRLPALQVAIQHEDKLVYSQSFGYADVEKKTVLTNQHVFRIASHSKTYTATAIAQLVEAGSLSFDDKVSKYLPWFKSSADERVADVTVRQLMNHTAGVIRDGLDADFWQLLREFPEEAELQAYISKGRLVYDSDTKFKYSNFGYGFLGLVIAKVSGVTYREYVQKNIIEKLGLRSTGPDLDDASKDLLAVGYGRELFRGERRTFPHHDTFDLSAATGFYANAQDVCRYFSAHFIGNTELVNDASKRAMQHGYWDTKDDGEKYGLGMIHYKLKGWDLYGHSGGFPGFITNTQFDAKRKLVVSVLTNSIDGPATMITKKLISIIDTFQQDTDQLKTKPADVSKFEGRFYSAWGTTDVVAVGKKLFAIEPFGWSDFSDAEELEIIDDTTLLIKDANGYSSPGEEIVYDFAAKSIRYAGTTLFSYEEADSRGVL